MKLNHSTKRLRALCKIYKQNRDNQSTKKWDKLADLDAIFAEMKSLGLDGCYASAGFFSGLYSDNKTCYNVNIGETTISMGRTKKGAFEWLDTIKG